MAKQNIRKGKSSGKKNLMFQITVGVIIAAFAGMLIIPNLLNNNTTENKELDSAVNSRTAYSFNKQGELVFTDKENTVKSKIEIEFADTPEKRATGLMFRQKMQETEGMLFLFDREEEQSFWMKNTFLSLDILYINSKREIVKIYRNTEPFSENSLPSYKPALYVLEVVAGYTQKFGINEGDIITWKNL